MNEDRRQKDPSANTVSWGEKFVTWQAYGITLTIITIGLGWALVATQQADARSVKRDDELQAQITAFTNQQRTLNDAVIRLVSQQENLLKTVDKIADKLNVN